MNKLLATLIVGSFSIGAFAANAVTASPAVGTASPSISAAKQTPAAKQHKKSAKAKPSAITPATVSVK